MNEIDVNKCEFYCEKYDGCYCFNSSHEVYAINPNEQNSCKANKDCHYKQLQQLQAENEELKNKNNAIHSIADNLQQRNHNLTLENEKLKKKINENNFCYNELLKLKDFFYNKAKTFYYYLDEIEEIVEQYGNNGIELSVEKQEQILHIIKQAKEGEEE